MAANIWQFEEQKFLQAIQDVEIPNKTLVDVDFTILKDKSDFELIPNGGGCYWIWTNEPVIHALHKNETPKQFDNGEVIYNGIAKDDVKGRIKHHLLGHIDAGWSGISMDVYFGDTQSHRKKGLSDSGKVPFLKEKIILKRGNKKSGTKKGDEIVIHKPIRLVSDFLKIHLSKQERTFINQNGTSKIHFRNGIDIFELKHQPYEFRAYYITGLNSLYLDFIEKNGEKNTDYRNYVLINPVDNMAKEWILNSAMNRFQLNFKRNVGPTSESIRACSPTTLDEWREYYFTKVRSKEHIEELGRKLYIKITEVIQSEVQELEEQDCIDYMIQLVIDRTYDGYTTEISTIYGQLQNELNHKIHPASDKWDRLFNVDFYILINEKYVGLQIKPVNQGIQLSQIFKERGLQEKTHEVFTKQFGGKVFYIFSAKVGEKKVILNREVIDEIKAEIKKLLEL